MSLKVTSNKMLQDTLIKLFPAPELKEGDRVKLLLWDDIDFYGTVEGIGKNEKGCWLFLVRQDDGSVSWFESEWLRKSDKLMPVDFGSCVLYPDTKHIVSVFKDRYTKEDLPKLREEAQGCEVTGRTGYGYSVVMCCIRALSVIDVLKFRSDKNEGRVV